MVDLFSDFSVGGLALAVEDNLFVGNDTYHGEISPAWLGIPDLRFGVRNPTVTLEIRGNTIARNASNALGSPYFTSDYVLNPGAIIERNLITGSGYGLWLPDDGAGFVVSCNLSWANGQNWVGLPDPTGQNGNLSEPPKYCNPMGDDFTLAENSPCLPENNSCGVLIGALGQGCPPIALTPETWARVKARYR